MTTDAAEACEISDADDLTNADGRQSGTVSGTGAASGHGDGMANAGSDVKGAFDWKEHDIFREHVDHF